MKNWIALKKNERENAFFEEITILSTTPNTKPSASSVPTRKIVVNGRKIEAFILAESETRVTYIPLDACHFTDYKQLREIHDRRPNNMLEEMRISKLKNGRNALVVYDNLIQVMSKTAGMRIEKADDPSAMRINAEIKRIETGEPAVPVAPVTSPPVAADQKPPPKKRGPKPKPKPKINPPVTG